MANITIAGLSIENPQFEGLGNNVTGNCTTAASTTVTFASTLIPQRYVGKSGWRISLGGTIYEVASTESTSSLTLTTTYTGSTGTTAFIIYPAVELRLYLINHALTPAGTSLVIQPGAVGSNSFYKRVCCSIYQVSGVPTMFIPSLTLYSTTDAPNPTDQTARYSAWFHTLNGSRLPVYKDFSSFALDSAPTSTTWAAIRLFNRPAFSQAIQNNSSYNTQQIDQLIDRFGVAGTADYYAVINTDGSGATTGTIRKSGSAAIQEGDFQYRGALLGNGTPQTLSGSGSLGAISLTTDLTVVTTTGNATATLAAGTEGQYKTIVTNTVAGTLTVTVTNLAGGGTQLVFTAADQFMTLRYVNGKWQPLPASGSSTGTTSSLVYTTSGITNDGTTDVRAALNTLVNTTMQAAGAGGRLVITSGTFLIGSNLTIPANVHIDGQSVGYIKVTTGKTLTVLGSMPRFPLQYFTNCGPSLGTVDFTGNYKIVEVFPEWFGADASLADSAGYTTNYRALYAAIHSAFGNRAAISAATNAATVQFTYTGAKISTGDTVLISGATGNWATGSGNINASWTATATGDHTFTIPVDSTSLGALSGTVVAHTRKNGINTQFNRTLIVNGEYSINDEIPVYHCLGFSIQGGNKLNNGIKQTANNKRIFAGDSIAYGTFRDLRFSSTATQTNNALIELDYTATQGDDLRPQNISFYDCVFDGNSTSLMGVWIAKTGGGAQGDNVRFVNCYGRSFTHSVAALGGDNVSPLLNSASATNAIEVMWLGGDIQNCPLYGLYGYGGSWLIDGTTVENQIIGGGGVPTQTGADFYITGNSFPAKIRNVRSESLRLLRGDADIDNVTMANTWVTAWFDSNSQTSLSGTQAFVGQLFTGSLAAGNGKAYKVTRADSNVSAFANITNQTGGPPLTTIHDSTASYVVNALVGLQIQVKYQSNGFITSAGTVTSNTATSITVTSLPQDLTNNSTQYRVIYSVPIWDGLGKTQITSASGTGAGATVTKTSAGWTINAFQNWRIGIVAGKGLTQRGKIASNTADTITLDASGWTTDYPLEYLSPDFAVTVPDSTSYIVIEPDWDTQTTSGADIEWTSFDYAAIDGYNPGSTYHQGYIHNVSVGTGAKVITQSTDIKGLQVSRADWNTFNPYQNPYGQTYWDAISVIRERGYQRPIQWYLSRNGSTAPLGPSPIVSTLFAKWLVWNRSRYGGGTVFTDLGIGPADDANGDSTTGKDVLAFAGNYWGKRSARGTNQAGTATNIAGGYPTGSGTGGDIGFYTSPTGASGDAVRVGSLRWKVDGANGHLLAGTDNTYDLGASGATRPRTGYFGTSVVSPVGTFATSISAPKLTNLTTNGLITTSSGDGTLGVTVPGAGILTWLATPSSANLASALTDETGSSSVVFSASPTFTGTVTVPTLALTNTGTATATAGAATSNTQSGVITTESLTTAAGATYTLTLTNSVVSATSKVFVSISNGTNSAGTPTLGLVTPGSGSVVITVRNTHSADAFNGTIKISFFVI